MAETYRNLYAKRRAAGLCGVCGKVKSEAARCPRCVDKLASGRTRLRHGVRVEHYGDKPATHDDIAQAMGVTRERVRQIEEQALAKMLRRGAALGLGEEDVMLGLARLGVMSGEQYSETRSVERCAHYEPRSYGYERKPRSCFGVGDRAGRCGGAMVAHPRRGANYCTECHAIMDGWGEELRKARVGGVEMAITGRA